MRALVTGATGLLGSNIVRTLVDDGHDVIAVVRSPDKARRVLPGDIDVVVGDLDDVAAFAPATDGCEAVFHTAAYFREYYRRGEHEALLRRRNVDATMQLLEEAARRDVGVVVHTSTSGLVGSAPDGGPGDETSTPPPVATSNRYFASKLVAERAIDAFLRRRDLRVVLVRPGWMFGPGDAAPTSAGDLALRVAAGTLPFIFRGGVNVADARDVAAAMVAAADKGASGERYNLAGDWHTLPEIMATLAAAAGVRTPRVLPDPVTHIVAAVSELVAGVTGGDALVDRRAVATFRDGARTSSEKAARELGFAPRPFHETADDAFAWFAANGMLPPDHRRP